MTTLTSRQLPLVPLQLNLTGASSSASENFQMHRHHHHHSMLTKDAMRLSSPKDEPNRFMTSFDSRRSTDAATVDELSDARSSSVSSYQADYNKEMDDDQRSYCSNDSELSVGKEVDDEQRPFSNGQNFSGKHSIGSESMDSNDASASVTTKEHMQNVIRPSPTRFQEEIIRKSQMYAEELMRHQMNFMAATRRLNLSPKAAEPSFGFPVRPDAVSPTRNDDIKVGFRPHVRLSSDLERKWSTIEDRSSHSPEATPYRGIHTHLNAISKITAALGRDFVQMTSTSESVTSRESSQSPSGQINPMLNNNINDSSLKFSIDNILKPTFGRRITDPLLKRTNKSTRKSTQRSTMTTNNNAKTPIDLTATQPTPTSPTASQSSQPAISSPTNQSATTGNGESEKKSGAPMVWPAWVYCTRYSDRPSSGKLTIHFRLFDFIS